MLKSQTGMGFIQAMIGGGLLVGGALLVMQQTTNTMKVQRQTDLRNVRNELTRYYSDLASNPVARTNTINAAQNAKLKAHIDGSTPAPIGTWSPNVAPRNSNINGLDLYDIRDNLAIPNDGIIHHTDGELCGPNTRASGCQAARGAWLVRAQWIALPSGQYEIRTLVTQWNRSKDDDLRLRTGDSISLSTASDNDWDMNGNIVYRSSGRVGVGTIDPQQTLQVTGNVRIAHPTDEVNYYMDIQPESLVAGDVYYHFKIKDDSGLSDESAMTIRGQDGFIGLGVENPTAMLHLKHNSNTELRIENSSNGTIGRAYVGDDSQFYLLNQVNPNGRITIGSNGNVGIGLAASTSPTTKLQVDGIIESNNNIRALAFVTTSDRGTKENVEKLNSVLDMIDRISAYRFEFKKAIDPESKKRIGVIAQEVQKIFPELVHKSPDGVLGVDYSMLAAPLVEAVKELHTDLKESKKTEARLKEENKNLREQLESLEANSQANQKSIEHLISRLEKMEAQQDSANHASGNQKKVASEK